MIFNSFNLLTFFFNFCFLYRKIKIYYSLLLTYASLKYKKFISYMSVSGTNSFY